MDKHRVQWALTSLGWAIDRIEGLAGTDDPSAQAATHDALHWACKADEYVGRGDEPLMVGLRYARDRAMHQMAETGTLLMATMGPVGQQTIVQHLLEPVPFIVWRSRDEMPPPPRRHDDPAKAKAYDAQLAGEVVVVTFFGVVSLLRHRSGLG